MQSLYNDLEAAAAELREYAGGLQSKALVRFLDALESTYMNDLRHIAPHDLVAKQACIRQVAAIRAVTQGEPINGRT